jgi:hypothetical protein
MALRVGSVTPRLVREVSLDITTLTAATIADQTFTVNGLETDMQLSVSAPTLEADILITNAHCSAANTLKLRLYSVSGLNPAATVFKIVAF